ncbi:MAG: hypothetical protein IPM48_09055 [Saprospiraceae bacterium]|nr:hypothetical protein [Saprospiraceae bacterium]
MEVLSFSDLIKILWAHKRLLLYIAFGTALVSGAMSFLLPEYYKSTTTFYPAKQSNVPINETILRRGNPSEFGETQDAEQALEILHSTSLHNRIIEQMDLYSHYEIDRNKPFAYTDVLKTFRSNFSGKRNKFNSIEIVVSDKDPEMAAKLANLVTSYYDTVRYEINRSRAQEMIRTMEYTYDRQARIIDSLKVKMDSITSLGVMSQFERAYLIQAYAEAGPSERAGLKKMVDINTKYGEDFDIFEKIYDREVENNLYLKKFIIQTKSDAENQLTQKFVVDTAIPAERKYYPVRWLVVAVSVLSSMVFAVSLLLIQSKWPEIRKQLEA